ncbi:MAG: hypothetical protein IKZ73_04845 [Lachnospiraceae bacterium]|jgi:hypothetical protein|nr:hypothetical protein [Lachnospiraceae bacterium]
MNTRSKEMFYLLLLEYLYSDKQAITKNDEILAKRLRGYYDCYVEHMKSLNSDDRKEPELSKSTLYKILNGNGSITINSLRSFAYMITDSGCYLPLSQYEPPEMCKHCTKSAFISKLIELIKDENWIINYIP